MGYPNPNGAHRGFEPNAKRLVVLVGSKRAIGQAVRTNPAGRRYAALAERLQRTELRAVRQTPTQP